MPAFYKKLKSGEPCTVSTAIRDFLHMSDFLSLMDRVLGGNETGTFNVSTGEGHAIEEIFHLVANHLGMTAAQPTAVVEPGDDDVAAVVLDPTRTTDAFNWSAQVGFKETISRMLHWYDKHGVTDVYSHLQAKQ
jgi:UDP-glucose 4-epimerase